MLYARAKETVPGPLNFPRYSRLAALFLKATASELGGIMARDIGINYSNPKRLISEAIGLKGLKFSTGWIA